MLVGSSILRHRVVCEGTTPFMQAPSRGDMPRENLTKIDRLAASRSSMSRRGYQQEGRQPALE